jgi:hypothetical protein
VSEYTRLWPWLPLAFAGTWLIVLAGDFRDITQSIYLSADLVSAPVIGELYDQRAPGAEVVLGNFPWYTTLWFEQLTQGLPGHRQIWQVGPWLFGLAGIAVVAWSAWRAANAWAAMIVAVLLACAGPALLTFQFGASIHALTFVHVCLLGGFLVLCAERSGQIGGSALHAGLCALLAVVTAAGLASDELLLVAGVGPFVLAAVALLWLLPAPAGRRIAISAAAVAVAAVVGAEVIGAVMEDAKVIATQYDVRFAVWQRLDDNALLFAESLAYLLNGDFGGAEVEARSVLELLCAVAVLTGAIVAVRYGRERVRAARAAPPADRREAARRAYVVFWLLAGVVLAVAFTLTSTPIDRYSARYVVTVGYAGVALVPLAALAAHARWRIVVVAATCLVLTGAIAGIVRGDLQDNPTGFPTGDVSGPLERLAAAQGLKYGYAGYWTAAPLTWQTKAAVQVYPVRRCTGGATLCPFPFHRISSWYTPRRGVRTFLIVDPRQTSAGAPRSPDPDFGRPARSEIVGHLDVFIYDYDIAARFGR